MKIDLEKHELKNLYNFLNRVNYEGVTEAFAICEIITKIKDAEENYKERGE